MSKDNCLLRKSVIFISFTILFYVNNLYHFLLISNICVHISFYLSIHLFCGYFHNFAKNFTYIALAYIQKCNFYTDTNICISYICIITVAYVHVYINFTVHCCTPIKLCFFYCFFFFNNTR